MTSLNQVVKVSKAIGISPIEILFFGNPGAGIVPKTILPFSSKPTSAATSNMSPRNMKGTVYFLESSDVFVLLKSYGRTANGLSYPKPTSCPGTANSNNLFILAPDCLLALPTILSMNRLLVLVIDSFFSITCKVLRAALVFTNNSFF